MRQLILATGFVTSGDVDTSTDYGKVGFAYLDKQTNKMKFTSTGNEILPDGEGYIVLLRKNEAQGHVVLPIHKNHFSFVKGTFDNSKLDAYSNSFTVPDVEAYLDYTVIVVRKGKKFNERNKWTATVHTKASDTPQTVATKLAKLLTENIGAGVTATVEGAKVTITGKVEGEDYAIVLADELVDVQLEKTTAEAVVMKAYGSAEYVQDLANKAAADAGFEYTYDEGETIYPGYPMYPLAAPDSEDHGFDIYTIRCAEPRDVKTRDEVVHQIVQIAVPTGQSGINTVLETLSASVASE